MDPTNAERPLEGLSAVVTGGSRGLGLLLSRELGRRGCAVTIAARDREKLQDAATFLREDTGARVHTRVCDVRDSDQVRALMETAAEREGGVDIAIGNAGIIQVGPVGALTTQDFRDAMDTIFFGALHTAMQALPHLRRSPSGGRLGLIGSIGGLLAVPHLLPYSCAKSAVGMLAEGLREEQAQHGVSVTAVHPGLMRTGSHLHARFAGDVGREFTWFSALAGTPVLSMDAERAASRIVTAVQRRRPRIVLTPAGVAADKLHGLAPAATTRLNTVAARLLPESYGQPGHTVEGAEAAPQARSRLRSLLSALNDRAARRFNQMGGAAGPTSPPAPG